MEIHHDIHVRNFVHCGGCSYNPNFENCNRAIMAQYVMAPIKTGSDSAKRLPDLESAVSKYVETRTRMSDPFWLEVPAQQESQSRKLVAKKTWLNVGKGPLRKVGGPKPITGPWPTHFQKWVGRSDYTRAPVTAVGGPDRLHPCVFLVLMCRRWAVKIVLVFTRKTSHRRRDPNPRNSLHSIRLSYLYALIDCATATVGRNV